MEIKLPAKIRLTIYLIVLFGTALIVPLQAYGRITDLVVAIWTSVAGAASGLAALNVNTNTK